jgi:hypothetical protein
VNKTLISLFFFFSIAFSATFSPNPDAGMVSVSVDNESVQNLLSIYENTGYHDLGTTNVLEKVNEIQEINKYYFENWALNLDNNDFKFNMTGVLDVDGIKKIFNIPFHPNVKTNGVKAELNAFFKDFGISSDGNVHLSVCLSDNDIDISDISYGYGYIVDKFIIDGIFAANEDIYFKIQSTINKAKEKLTDATNCIDITDYITISYPKFLEPIGINHSGAKVENNKIHAYGCPIAKTMIGDVVVIGDGPCETISYNISVYTAKDINNAGTNSQITLSLCGDDLSGNRKCLPEKKLNELTQKGEIAHLLVESSALLVKNLSITLNSDNSGKQPGWYADSVIVDMTIPNNNTYHYWFPIHSWIGGSNPNSFTFNQNDSLQVYTFGVETGKESHFDHSGTDSHILSEICDINDKCLLFKLDKPEHDDFEEGSFFTYTVITNEKLSNIKSITLHNIYDGEHSGWYVQDVTYNHYSFPENINHSIKDSQIFMFRQWLASGENKGTYYTWDKYYFPRLDNEGIFRPLNSSQIIANRHIYTTRYINDNFGYNVIIKTKDGGSSGTDAKIRLILEGCSGEQEVFDLNDDKNNFEKGNVDVFRFSGIKDLKGIKKIYLKNDGSGEHPGWSPEYIDVVPIIYSGLNLLYHKEHYHHDFIQSLNSEGWDWESEILNCPDINTPIIYSNIFEVTPGDMIIMQGANLNDNHDIVMNLNKQIKPKFITSRFVGFEIPKETPFGEYNIGSITINGVAQQVFVHVRGEKPILDGIAINTAEPGEAFEASMRNINKTTQFYLGNYALKLLAMSKKGAYLQIPNDIEKGFYPFKIVANGWNLTYDETIEITNSMVPHISSISENIVYIGQIVNIYGENFGNDTNVVKVFIGNKKAQIKVLENEKISIQIPTGMSGKDIAVNVVRENISNPEEHTIEIKGLPWFMSFDDIMHTWTSDNADLSYDDFIKYGNSGYSLKIHGEGYKVILSPTFNTYELREISDSLLLDIWLPEMQINPYWYGDIQMSINIPAAGMHNTWFGQVSLTDLKFGWNTITFPLSQNILAGLNGDYPNATFSIILNTNQNPDDIRIDNLRFGGNIKIRTTEHGIANKILDIYSADFMSFDDINDWTQDPKKLLFVEAPKTQGLGATGILASGYTELKSSSFTPSEIKDLSNIIALDVYIPNPQPNEFWIGDINLTLSCPDNGIYSMNLGSINLTHMFREEYNTIQFLLPNEAVTALSYGINECFFSIYLNVNNGAGLFLLDNMRFIRLIEFAGRW